MKRVKARQDFGLLNIAANESLENGVAFRARKLAFDAIMGVRSAQGLAAALHLRAGDFDLWLQFNGKITHERTSNCIIPFARHFRLLPSRQDEWPIADTLISWMLLPANRARGQLSNLRARRPRPCVRFRPDGNASAAASVGGLGEAARKPPRWQECPPYEGSTLTV